MILLGKQKHVHLNMEDTDRPNEFSSMRSLGRGTRLLRLLKGGLPILCKSKCS